MRMSPAHPGPPEVKGPACSQNDENILAGKCISQGIHRGMGNARHAACA